MRKSPVALLFGLAMLMNVNATGQAPPAAATVAFDVVSIRPSAKDGGNAIYVNLLPSGIYTTRNMTVDGLIKEAYGFGLRVIDLPDWASAADSTFPPRANHEAGHAAARMGQVAARR